MGGGKGDSCQTTGYRYYTGLHLIFCHKADKLLEIIVGEKSAWSGDVSSNTSIYIDKYELFGGEGKEGGIQGKLDICFGESDQPRNSYLQSLLGSNVPAFRNFFGFIGNQIMVAINNPYIKEWEATLQRTRIGWRDDLADIVASDGYIDMNPSHMIRECVTNKVWGGLGYPEVDIDDQSFQNSANLLKAEGLGLSLVWAKESTIDEFISIILNHIDGKLFFSHSTGLLTLKLIRKDYSVAGQPLFNESNIVELIEYIAPSATEAVNSITVTYTDRNNNGKSVTIQDIASIMRSDGVVNPLTIDFPGVATEDLAIRLASRELQQLAMPISSIKFICNRKDTSTLEPGSVINFSWNSLGISNMAMRIEEIEYDVITDNKIQITAYRDVYGIDDVSIRDVVTSLWTPGNNDPVDALHIVIQEITWYQFVKEGFGDSQAVLDEIDNNSTFIICTCAPPTTDSLNYQMWTKVVGSTDWTKADTDDFPFVGTLSDDLIAEDTTIIQLQESFIDTIQVVTGMYALIESEFVKVISVDSLNMQVTVDRGVIDTVPVAHASGNVIMFYQSYFGLDRTERVVTESVDVKILPTTSNGTLALNDALSTNLVCQGRMMRPYPPGNLWVNNYRYKSSVIIDASEELVINWSHRDRTQQTVSLVNQLEGNIGPEVGTTYTLSIYGESDTLIRTVTGLTGTSYTYTSANEISDSGLGRLNNSLRFELKSVRSTLDSFTKWNINVVRSQDTFSTVSIIADSSHVKSTSNISNHYPFYAVDTTKSLTGGSTSNSWIGVLGSGVRFNVDLVSSEVIKRLYIENSHTSGTDTDVGVKRFKVYGSNSSDAFNNTTPSNLDDLEFIDWINLDEHISSDSSDPQYIYINNTASYRYYIIIVESNYGDASYCGFRRIEFQTKD